MQDYIDKLNAHHISWTLEVSNLFVETKDLLAVAEIFPDAWVEPLGTRHKLHYDNPQPQAVKAEVVVEPEILSEPKPVVQPRKVRSKLP